MKAFCEFNEYEIVGEYEDAGKSGKSIEGRVVFNNMMEDIKSGKLPIISKDMKISLDNGSQIETVVLLSKKRLDSCKSMV